jgi:hypothetical protein
MTALRREFQPQLVQQAVTRRSASLSLNYTIQGTVWQTLFPPEGDPREVKAVRCTMQCIISYEVSYLACYFNVSATVTLFKEKQM